jgi:hypothetical protein
MRGRFVQIVVLACSFVLVLPPGWSCALGAGPCCEATTGADEVEKADADTCCCCSRSGDERREESPAKPSPPRQSECCEWQPTTTVKPVQHAIDLSVTGQLHFLELEPMRGVVVADRAAPLSRPLQVLHCIWLC